MGGAELVNVPILNTAEAVSLTAGHMVALLRFKSSYFILGRVTLPGSDQFAAAAVHFATDGVLETGFALGAAWAVKGSTELAGPAWATEALVYTTVALSALVPAGTGKRIIGVRPVHDGDDGPYSQHSIPQGDYGSVTTAQATRIERDNFDTDPITVACEAAASPSIAAAATTYCQIHTFAIFRRAT